MASAVGDVHGDFETETQVDVGGGAPGHECLHKRQFRVEKPQIRSGLMLKRKVYAERADAGNVFEWTPQAARWS